MTMRPRCDWRRTKTAYHADGGPRGKWKVVKKKLGWAVYQKRRSSQYWNYVGYSKRLNLAKQVVSFHLNCK